eukprot:m.136084 g.136084  ORF g.136084 m.136084 type:complete len:524 (+) comp14722_c0_seq7:204-1775(+)
MSDKEEEEDSGEEDTHGWDILIKQDLRQSSPYRKHASRRARKEPIPSELRPQVWKAASLGITHKRDHQTFAYCQSACQKDTNFPEGSERLFCCSINVQEFGHKEGLQSPKPPADTYTSMLQCLAWTHKESGLDLPLYMPWLPPIVSLLLRWCDEETAFSIALALAPPAGPFKSDEATAASIIHTRISSWLMLKAFVRLARKKLKSKLRDLASRVGVDEETFCFGMVTEWMWSVAPPMLPWMLDCFMLEGQKFAYRFGLAVVYEGNRQITSSSNSVSHEAQIKTVIGSLTNTVIPSLYKQFKFKSAKLIKYHKEGFAGAREALEASGKPRGVGEYNFEVNVLFSIEDKFIEATSLIQKVGKESLNLLWKDLPARLKHRKARLLYSSAVDGCRLATMIAKCTETSDSILFVQGRDGDLCGAFASVPWATKATRYFGTGESFLYKCKPDYSAFKWVDDGRPNYFLYAEMTKIAVGGGGKGHGLELDEEFRICSTEECDTFKNERLSQSGSSAFPCSCVEVWGLSPS